MGNCFLTSKFNEQTLKDLEIFKNSYGYYRLGFNFKDLNLNLLEEGEIKNIDCFYSIYLIFTKYEFINTYIYKNIKLGDKYHSQCVTVEKENAYFNQRERHTTGFYFSLTSYYICPTIYFFRKINHPLYNDIYDKLLSFV